MNFPRWYKHLNKSTGEASIYNPQTRLCACKGTGLVPTNEERIGKEPQAYCPYHKCKRYWPQLQTDGSVKYFELTSQGLNLNNERR
jgi:hypothetical protein